MCKEKKFEFENVSVYFRRQSTAFDIWGWSFDFFLIFFVFCFLSICETFQSAGQDEGLKLFAAGDEERQTVCRKKHAGNPVKGKIGSLFKQNKNISKG